MALGCQAARALKPPSPLASGRAFHQLQRLWRDSPCLGFMSCSAEPWVLPAGLAEGARLSARAAGDVMAGIPSCHPPHLVAKVTVGSGFASLNPSSDENHQAALVHRFLLLGF